MKHKLAALFFTATTCLASPVVWSLSANLNDFHPWPGEPDSIIRGSFTYDAGLNLYSNFSIVVGSPIGGFLFTAQNPGQMQTASGFFLSYFSDGLSVNFLSPLTDDGGTVSIGAHMIGVFDCDSMDCSRRFGMGTNYAATVAVGVKPHTANPEPSSWALAIVGLVVFIAAVRRK